METKAYDPENIFAKILRGDMPKVSVFEDDEVLAFMDVFPQAEGHTLVIPKYAQATNFLDIAPDALGILIQRTQKVARAIDQALKPDGIQIIQFNGEAAGQSVFHIHFHIIPVRGSVTLKPHGEGMADMNELEAIAAKIRAEL